MAESKAAADEVHWNSKEAEAKAAKDSVALAEAQKNKVAAAQAKAAAKTTEAAITSKILSSPAYMEAQAAYQQAEYKVNLLFGGVLAMNARKGMLESLVRLIVSDWYSEPRVKGGESMKADASNRAMEEAALRAGAAFTAGIGPKVVGSEPGEPPLFNEGLKEEPATRWAIGPVINGKKSGMSHGPFVLKDNALAVVPQEIPGAIFYIYRLDLDGSETAVFEWSRVMGDNYGWMMVGLAPKRPTITPPAAGLPGTTLPPRPTLRTPPPMGPPKKN
jgi:hypothetical protein